MPNATRVEWIAKVRGDPQRPRRRGGRHRSIPPQRVSQSIRELEWRQADMARTMINAMMRDEGWQAMTMLDWEEGRDVRRLRRASRE